MNEKNLLKETRQGFAAAKALYQPLVDRRKFNLELYTGYDAKFTKENMDGVQAHVPYVKTLFDGVFPILTGKMPVSKVSARNTQKSWTAARLMDRLINYTFDVNQFEKKYMMVRKDSMLAADAFVMVDWSPDPDKNHPLLIHLNPDDVFPHPAKLDIDDEWPIYIRREMTRAQMKEMGWDKGAISGLGESKLGTKSYRKQQLKKLGLSDGSTAKEDEDEDEDKKDDLYEVVYRWGMMKFGDERKMGCVIMANEEKIINNNAVRDDLKPFESPQKNNVLPISHLQYDPLPHSFFGQSFIDPIAKDQVELNDLENMKRSNYYRRNNPPLIVDKNAQVDLSTLKFMTGLPWVVKGGANAITPYILPDLAPSIYNDQKLIMTRMQNVTGASDYLNPTPETVQKSGKSATHANIMNENTKMRFRPQAVSEDRFMEKLGKILINLWQDKDFFNEEVALAMVDDEGESEITIIKNDLVQGDLDFVVTSASSIAQSDSAVLNMAVQIKQLYTGDPTKDLSEVDRTIIDKAGFDPNKIIKPKVGMLPELKSQLDRWTFLTKQPNFEAMPANEKSKVYDRIKTLMGLIKELAAKAEKDNPAPQQPPQGSQTGQPSGPGQVPPPQGVPQPSQQSLVPHQ